MLTSDRAFCPGKVFESAAISITADTGGADGLIRDLAAGAIAIRGTDSEATCSSGSPEVMSPARRFAARLIRLRFGSCRWVSPIAATSAKPWKTFGVHWGAP